MPANLAPACRFGNSSLAKPRWALTQQPVKRTAHAVTLMDNVVTGSATGYELAFSYRGSWAIVEVLVSRSFDGSASRSA